jgi:two-component sensor histidine kinase/tetratricopeptide (TPR) repeat protein
MLLLLLTGCSDNRDVNRMSSSDFAKFRALSDSITHFSPGVIHVIERGMKEARDSFTYYRYCLLKSKYFVLSATPDSLIVYADSCIRFAQRQPASPSQKTLIALAFNYKAAGMHNFHQSPDTQIQLYTRAYNLLLDGEEQYYLPDLCANLGDSYEQKNDLPQAANWYRRALFLADSLELPNDSRVTLNMGLGYIYQNLGDYTTARQYYESIQKPVSKEEPSIQAYFLTNFGNMFYYSHDYKSALRIFLRLQKMLLKYHLSDTYDMNLCRINLADVYLNLHSLDNAEKYLAACYPYFKKLGDPVALYYANTIRIGIAILRNQTELVPRILSEETLSKKGVDQNLVNIRNGYLLHYYEKKGDYETAYRLQNDVRTQLDSLEQNRQHMRAAEVMMRFEQDTLQLHHQLTLQKMDAHIDHMYALSTLLFVLIVILLGSTWIFYRHRQQKNNLKLMQLRLADARNRISPHFVFNVLNSRMGNSMQVQQDQLLTLASVIRQNLDLSTQQFVTLRQEVEFVQRYVSLEQSLTGGFSFEMQLPSEELLDQCQLPPMLLQILIENAIKHGVKSDPSGSHHIWVEVTMNNEEMVMIVRNDGAPFDIRKSGKGTGLNIIRTTMAAMNMIGRQRMSYRVTDDHGKGCCAMITIKQSKIKLTEK